MMAENIGKLSMYNSLKMFKKIIVVAQCYRIY